MKRKLKFGDYYQDDWNYDELMGVGLSFQGVPSDYKKFLDILMGVSCNPISARRILDILEKGETKFVTVMALLNFHEIGDALKEIGVTMKITPPFNYAHPDDINNNSQVDLAVFHTISGKESNIKLDERFKNLYEERLLNTQKSIQEKPHNFGPYER